LDLDAPQLKKCVRTLKEFALELAYLALLTRHGLKPLSRWEKPLHDTDLRSLTEIGLLTEKIRRTVKTGRQVTETIFSPSPAYIHLYRDRFADSPIDKSAPTIRFEGFLFGFPHWCVDQFIRHPYIKNDLDPQLQKILFQWACPRCRITPILLPAYLKIHRYLEDT
jgi:hypothetical protein